ncbi:MAG TPA: SCO2521 family protein [Micromonosporaceae bacterium]|jgi:hypothetical protein|nr:SCO2521 family protein [Micromonosporaceae bacterium]
MGEVHTGLLQHSAAVSADFALRLLTPVPGVRARRVDRPIAYAVSPDTVTGVDCELPSAGAKVRGVGSIVSRVAITGGHVVQGSAFVRVRRGVAGRRLPWSHYMAAPGIVETMAKVDSDQLAAGFLAPAKPLDVLDIGAIGARAMDMVQSSPMLDHNILLKSSRTRLRWAIETLGAGAEPAGAVTGSSPQAPPLSVTFTVRGDGIRTVLLRAGQIDPSAVAALCEDLALHDWLLTTLLAHVGQARIGTAPRSAVVKRLQPTIDYLLHLWMPAARVDAALADLWLCLDRQPGLTRQWQATVDRVRDQLALATVEVLTHARD